MVPLKRKHWIYIVAGAAVIALIALWARPDTFEVESIKVARGPLRVTIDEQGFTRIRTHTEIAAPITGRIAESMVAVGDAVSAGMTVARISPAPLDPRTRAEAAAAILAARSIRNEADSRVVQARLALDEARRDRSRAEQLSAAGAIAARELEQAVTQEQLRSRELDAAKAHARATMEEEQRARSALMGADVSGSGSRAFVDVRSPMKGVVLRLFEEHQRVIPAGTPIMEIGNLAGIELVVDVLTRDAASIPKNALMIVQTADKPEWRARVQRIEPAAFTKVSPLGIEEQRVNVIGRFIQLPVGIGDKFEAEVSIVLWEKPDVLLVPSTSLVPMGTGWSVFVIENKKVHVRSVTIRHRGSREVEILSGVKEGEAIVMHPDDRLSDGVRVKVK